MKLNIGGKLFGLAAMAAALTFAPAANASVCTTADCIYTFNSTAVGAFGAGPYGTVELALNSGFINFTITLLPNFHMIDTGNHVSFSFNDPIAETLTISSFSDSIYSQASGAGPFANPGYGDFSAAVQSTCSNGGGCGDRIVSFSVSRTGGFTSVTQLVSSNGSAYFAADVSCSPTTSCPASAANGNTGAIAVTTVPVATPVPEPITSGLVGTGLVGLFFLRRKKA